MLNSNDYSKDESYTMFIRLKNIYSHL